MENQQKQTINLIFKAKNILLITKQSYNGDDIAVLLAWHLWLKKYNLKHDVVIDNFKIKNKYKFLPGWQDIRPQLNKLKKFTISVDTSQTGLDDISYDAKETELLIHLSPQRGFFETSNIKFHSTDFKYDLVVILGSPDLNSLGKTYQEHADFFYNVPIINIDKHHMNEYFGTINLVDITKNSLSEITYDLFQNVDPNNIGEQLASCLLTGLISATQSFRLPAVNPNTLSVASTLINKGANRKYIVEQLFNTKSISTLRLWGRALTNLKVDQKNKLVWTRLTESDLNETGAELEELTGVIDEIISTSPQAEIIAIFFTQEPNITKLILHSNKNYDSYQLAGRWQPQGDKDLITAEISLPIHDAEQEVIKIVQEKIESLIA